MKTRAESPENLTSSLLLFALLISVGITIIFWPPAQFALLKLAEGASYIYN